MWNLFIQDGRSGYARRTLLHIKEKNERTSILIASTVGTVGCTEKNIFLQTRTGMYWFCF